MAVVLNFNEINADNNFKKCGEIITRGENEFFLVCTFCENAFLKLDHFIAHIEKQHFENAYEEIRFKKEINGDIGEIISEDFITKSRKYKVKVTGAHRNINTTHKDRSNSTTLIEEEIANTSEQENGNTDPLAFLITDIKNESKELDSEVTEPLESQNVDTESSDPFQGESNKDSDGQSDVTTVKDHDPFGDEITTAIIAEYKEHPVLWSNDYPHSKYKAWRTEVFQQITNKVNNQFNLNLEWEIVRKKIKRLRGSYTQNPNVWYGKQLEFLKPTIEHNQRALKKVMLYEKTKSGLPFQNLTKETNIKLVSIYKRFPSLWDVQSIEYRFSNRRQEALLEMQKAILDELGLKLTKSQVQKKIARIRYASSQEKQRKIECERLEKVYEPISEYYEHIRFLECNVGPFQCEVCKELFGNHDPCQIHKSSHDGSMPFICSLCNRGFKCSSNLTVHLRRHTRDYPFECKTCKKRFAIKSDMNVHIRQHTGEKPYFCEICGQSFRTWTFFDLHSRRHQKKTSHKCSICPKSFYYNAQLTEHMETHLDVRDKVCNVCEKTFKTRKMLRRHKLIHVEEKKYICKICEKGFAQYSGLSGHMKTHGTTLIQSGVVKIDG